jgi:hypothetical protein
MENEVSEHYQVEIPDNALKIQQSSWAWLWPAFPWVVLALVSMVIDIITFGLLPMLLATIWVLPRYIGWRRTSYILTHDHIIVIQGALGKNRRFDIPVDQIESMETQPGFFGRSLGYFALVMAIKDKGLINLPYTPERSYLEKHIQAIRDNEPPPHNSTG